MKRAPIYRRGQTWYSAATRRSLGTRDRAEALKLERASRRTAKETDGPVLGDAPGPVDSPPAPAPVNGPEAATPPATVDSLSPVAGAAPSKPEGDPLSELGADPSPPEGALAPEVAEVAQQLGLGDVVSAEQVKEIAGQLTPVAVGVLVKLTGIAAGWVRTTPAPPPDPNAVALLTKLVDIKITRALQTAQVSENAVFAVAIVAVFGSQAFMPTPEQKPAEPSLH